MRFALYDKKHCNEGKKTLTTGRVKYSICQLSWLEARLIDWTLQPTVVCLAQIRVLDFELTSTDGFTFTFNHARLLLFFSFDG